MLKNVSKPVIAVDIDDVLLPFADLLTEHHNLKYGTELKFEDVRHHNFGEYWGVSHEEYLKRTWKFMIDSHKTAVPIPGAVRGIKKLSQKYQIAVITFRSPPVKEATHAWLDKHLSGYVEEPIFIGSGSGDGSHTSTKAEICQRIGAKWLIDDHLKPVIEASVAGINGLLFGNYPWNQSDDLPKNVRRVNDWQEVLEYFDAKSR